MMPTPWEDRAVFAFTVATVPAMTGFLLVTAAAARIPLVRELIGCLRHGEQRLPH